MGQHDRHNARVIRSVEERLRQLIAAVLLYPAIALCLSPVLLATSVQAQTAPSRLLDATSEETSISASIDPASLPTGAVELAAMNLAGAMLSADMSGLRRLKVNQVDKAQFEAYAKIETYARLNSNHATDIIDGEGNIDTSKLSQSYKNQIGVDRLSDYSRRLIRSIIDEVTPTTGGGAGHEFANVFRITKDHRTEGNRDSEESVPPFGEEPRESQHFKDNGKAVDVSELDYLRGTKFTIETLVDAKTGKPIIRDGKPVEEVIDYEHLPLEGIQFVWQSEEAASKFPGTLPSVYGQTPHNAAQTLSGNHLKGVLQEEYGKRGSGDFNFDGIDLTHVTNLGELSQVLGQGVISQAMGESSIQLGPNAPLWTGQQSLSQASGLPSFGFYGTSLDGAPDGQPGLLMNMGREVVFSQRLGLPEGAGIGNTSDEIFTNVGERTFEMILGDLPLGTLDGIQAGNRASLETHVGRGLVAKQLNLFLSQVPLGASTDSFKQSLGYQSDVLATTPRAYDTSLGLANSGATQQVLSGQLSPDAYFQRIGAERLKILEAYGTETDKRRADTALNLDERPNLYIALKELPTSPDPNTSTKDAFDGGRTTLTESEHTAAVERARFALNQFSFRQPARELLEGVVNGNRSGDIRFILSDAELTAYLLDTAYVKGANTTDPPKVTRFLSADTGVFYEVGTDQVAKAIVKENDGRAALRSYFRTGTMPTLDDKATPVVDLNNLVGQVGLRSRADFEAIFRSDAPLPVFEMVGRRSLLASFGQDPVDIAHQSFAPVSTTDEARTRLETLSQATDELVRATSGETQSSLRQAATVLDQLTASLDETVLSGKRATPQAWTSSILNLYQVSQAVAGEADQFPSEYRAFALAVADLATGNTSSSLYTLGDNLFIQHPVGQAALTGITGIFNGTATPNEAIRSFGNSVISQAGGLDPNTGQLLYDLLGAATTQRAATTDDIRSQLRSFAADHVQELAEASLELNLQTYGYDLDGRPLSLSDSASTRQTQLAEAMIRLMAQGETSPTGMAAGASIVDEAFGIQGYQVSDTGYGTWGMISTDVGGAIDQVMERAQRDQKVMELLTGQTNADLTLQEQGNLYAAAGLRYVAGLTGLPFNPRWLDAGYEFSMDEGILLAEGLTGQSIDQIVRSSNIPIVGDFLADRTTMQAFLNGQIFDGDSAFWQNQSYLGHLEQVAGQAGIPTGLITTLFDRNLTDDQRSAQLEGTFTGYIQAQVTPDRINELFGLADTDFAVAGDAISGSLGILLSDSITDKGAALQALGSQIGDNYLAANYGFSVGWLWDTTTGHAEKIATGLDILTSASGLDPTIGDLAQNAYRTFFLGNGIDTATLQGRQNLSSLVGSLGAAAGVPGEFTSLAAGLLAGDMETTLITYAGQGFIDQQLSAFGITDVTFSDMYQAFIAPLPEVNQLAYNTAWNEIVTEESLNFGTTASFVEVVNPNTGESVRLEAGAAAALDARTGQLREAAQTTARTHISYALGDALISQAFGGEVGGSVRGITQAMMTGTTDQRLTAFSGMLANLSQDPVTAQIFGSIDTARELSTFFSTPGSSLSSGAIAQMDGWFSSVTGIDTPAGSMSAMLDFARSGDIAAFSNLVSPDSLVGNFGGFIDQSLGLPAGTTQLANAAYQAYTSASSAVSLAESQLFNVSGGADALQVFQAQEALNVAQTQFALTQANLVATGVNLIFGQQIAAIDSALGLPSGTASMLVTAGITSLMVPGMTLSLLASSVFLPALAGMLLGSLLSGGGLGGLFGGGTKKIKRNEILWSYHVSDPALRSIADSHGDEKDIDGVSLKPKEEVSIRADWPEEAWFVKVEDPGESPENPNVIAPGKNIALKTDKQLPVGIFRGNTKQQFRTGSVGAAKRKIHELIGDLLTMNTRLSDTFADGKPNPEDTSYIPNEIWTHNRQDVESYEGLINTVYGQGEIGSYQEHIDTYRRGIGFDERMSLLVRWVHWQY